MYTFRTYCLLWLFALLSCIGADAQTIGIKTNLLYDATLTPNLGAEVALGQRTTAQVVYGLNPWKFSSTSTKQLRHWVLQPSVRRWFCQRFNGGFVEVHALGGEYNVGGIDLPNPVFSHLKDSRYEGWYLGGGVGVGYQWPLSRHWNLEASAGLGYIRFHYKEFPCTACGALVRETDKNYFGPTKLALSLMYCF